MRKWFTCCIALAALLGLTLAGGSAFSQQRWQKTYGGTDYDFGWAVQQTSDGGYICAGGTWSFGAGGYDFWLVKTNAQGDTLWTKTYGTVDFEEAYAVRQTADGGYIIAGVAGLEPSGWSQHIYLIKTNAQGNTQWTKMYGGGYHDGAFSIQQTNDGGYIVAGYREISTFLEYVYLLKLNSSGDSLWSKTYGRGGMYDAAFCVQQTQDGGYIVVGRTTEPSGAYYDIYLLKTNAQGDTLWSRTYGEAGEGHEDMGYFVRQTQDGGYVLTGTFQDQQYNDDLFLIKTNAAGATQWTKMYTRGGNDWGSTVKQTTDGGYIIAGTTYYSDTTNYDVWLLKTNASGDTAWTKTYGGSGPDNDRTGFWGDHVQQTTDGGYIILGGTGSFGAGHYDFWLIKTDSLGSSGVEEERAEGGRPQAVSSLKTTPNPFVSFATVPGHENARFALYDVSGRLVGKYQGNRIGEGLRAGVYFLKQEGKDAKPVRIVKVR